MVSVLESRSKDQHPIQGGVEILLESLYATETGISSGLMGHLARIQTLPFYNP